MASPAVLERLSEAADKKSSRETLLEMLGDLSEFKVLKNYILVALYVGGQYVPGTKIIRSDNNRREDIFQGMAGLVLKIGPTAFDDVSKVSIGDWVTFSPGDGKRIQIRGVDCRVFHEDNLQMVIPNPDQITHRQ